MAEYKLTEEIINRLCSDLRAIDFCNKHTNELNSIPEFKDSFEALTKGVKQIWDLLSEEQRDKVLEEHKSQMADIAKQQAKNKKKEK
jgi:hypothetical protein